MTQTKSRKNNWPIQDRPGEAAVEILVLVPVMNEAGNIRPLIDEIARHVQAAILKSFMRMMPAPMKAAMNWQQRWQKFRSFACCAIPIRAGQSAAIRSALHIARGHLIGVLMAMARMCLPICPVWRRPFWKRFRLMEMGLAWPPVFVPNVRTRQCGFWHRGRQSGFA